METGSTREYAGKKILELGATEPNLCVVGADLNKSTFTNLFAAKYPDRFFDVGIAEQHAVTFAGGLATESIKPFVAIYSTFLQRAYDQVIHDIALQSLPVRFLIDRSGFVGADGATHAGSFDLTYLSCLPNFIVMAPSSGEELKNMINFSLSVNNKPTAIRYPRDLVGEYNEKKPFQKLELGKGKIVKKGNKIAFLNLGTRLNQVLETSSLVLKKFKIESTIVDMRFAKPIDTSIIKSLIKNHDILITVEENSIGGFSAQVNHFLINTLERSPKVLNFFMKDDFIDQSDINDQYDQSGISPEKIIKKLSSILK